MADVLGPELDTYRKHHGDLLSSDVGRWVLIHGERVLHTFATQQDAINEGYRVLGNVPFLVKQITPVETVTHLVSNLILA